jgi:type VI secretion system secreted protein Hcp
MAFDCFLKIDGIPGESEDAKHKDEIEVLSYSWGVSQTGTFGSGGGGGAGKAVFQDFHFVSGLQKSSPKLFLACATGQHIKEAVLTCRSAGEVQAEFYKMTLTDVLVSSYQHGGSAESGESVPIEQTSLNFAKIRTDYTQRNAKGSIGGTFSAEFDLKRNVGSEPTAGGNDG